MGEQAAVKNSATENIISKASLSVIPAPCLPAGRKAGIQKRHWMPDQVRHDRKFLCGIIYGRYGWPVRNEKGVGLVEVMVALVVLLLVFMGLLQSALLSIDHNLRNVVRDEAVKIADQRMNGRLADGGTTYDGLRIISFDALNGIATGNWNAVSVTRNFRNIARQYNVCWRITRVDVAPTETMRIEVAVGWNHRGENVPQQVGTGNAATTAEYVHQVTTLRRI